MHDTLMDNTVQRVQIVPTIRENLAHPRKAQQELNRIFSQSQTETSDPLALPNPPKVEDWIRTYKKSANFHKLYHQSLKYYLKPHENRVLLSEGRKDIDGQVFEDLSYMFLKATLPDNQHLLSSEQTLSFFEFLYNRRRVPIGGVSIGREEGIEGIRTPDGLVVRKSGPGVVIDEVIEYTTSCTESYRQRKIEGLRLESENFPKLFSRSRLRFLTLKQQTPLASTLNRVLIDQLPLTQTMFVSLIDDIITQPQFDEDDASLQDIQIRVRQQVAKKSKLQKTFLTR